MIVIPLATQFTLSGPSIFVVGGPDSWSSLFVVVLIRGRGRSMFVVVAL